MNTTRYTDINEYRHGGVVGVDSAGTMTAWTGVGAELHDLILGETDALAIGSMATSTAVGSFILATPILLVCWLRQRRR